MPNYHNKEHQHRNERIEQAHQQSMHRLQQFIKHRGLNISRLAELLEVSKPSLYRNLDSKSYMTYHKLVAMCLAFPELNMHWLITGEGPMLKDDTMAKHEGLEVMQGQIEQLEEDKLKLHAQIEALQSTIRMLSGK